MKVDILDERSDGLQEISLLIQSGKKKYLVTIEELKEYKKKGLTGDARQ